MSETTFEWIGAYEAIANSLLGYEERQDELCALLKGILGETFSEMDPLTFFSAFNGKRRGYAPRADAVSKIVDFFGLEVDKPKTFDGIPTTNPLRWRFWDGKPDTIRHNWEYFRAALDYADNPTEGGRVELARLFDVVHAQGNVGDANVTMALYWVRPNSYLPLDGNTRPYLWNRYNVAVPKPLTGDSYLKMLDEVHAKTDEAFPSISNAAWELGGWIPAPSEFDPGITKEGWLDILADGALSTQNVLVSLKCLAEHPDGITCSELDDDYGRGSTFYSNNIATFGEKIAKRLGLQVRDVQNGKYWPVACVGRYVGKGRHGSFEWRLRKELLSALAETDLSGVPLHESDELDIVPFDADRLRKLIALYKQDFMRFRGPDSEEGGDQEAYKWDDLLAYRENWDIEADDFADRLVASLKPASTGQGALLGNGFSYPYGRLSKLVAFDQDAVREAFKTLYDHEKPLRDAYTGFVEQVQATLEEYNSTEEKPLEGDHQTPSAASLYLFFEMPDRYHFFKPRVASHFAESIGAQLPSNPVAKLLVYERLCDQVLPLLMADDELVSMADDKLTDEQKAADLAHHLLLQDVAYYSSRYMRSWHQDWEELLGMKDDDVDDVEAVQYPKNLILFGPPGTGKTYRTRAYAVAICDGVDVSDVLTKMEDPDGYDEIAKRYDELVSAGRIAFTTFHQSYGYEEFIEGLRPEYDDDKDVVTYPLRKGVFREFCEAAEDVVAVASTESGVPRFAANPKPRVWKMGLKTGEVADLLDQCRDGSCLRMGWDAFPPDVVDESEGLSKQNRNAINAFQEEMQPGDFVVIPGGGSTAHYDVAVVTGDFEWREDLGAAMRYRSAQWLDPIEKTTFLQLNGGKALTLQTVYELTRVSASKLVEAMGLVSEPQAERGRNRPFVFVIDEINRGNVSKVFGELITLLEPTKRKGEREQLTAKLPYSGDDFSIPSNVYVIGTMNTADRSIALMDTALRRRFDFVEVTPEPELLKDVAIEGVDVARMLGVMNRRVELLYDREHTLGHAFFMGLREDPSVECLAGIFMNKVIPLLQEYFFDDYAKIRSVLGAAANRFVEVIESDDVFWEGDDTPRDGLSSYRLLPMPTDAEAYAAIYQRGGGGQP